MIYARLTPENQSDMYRIRFTCTKEEGEKIKETILTNNALWRKEGWHHSFKKDLRFTGHMNFYLWWGAGEGIGGFWMDNAHHILNKLGFTPVSETFFYLNTNHKTQ